MSTETQTDEFDIYSETLSFLFYVFDLPTEHHFSMKLSLSLFFIPLPTWKKRDKCQHETQELGNLIWIRIEMRWSLPSVITESGFELAAVVRKTLLTKQREYLLYTAVCGADHGGMCGPPGERCTSPGPGPSQLWEPDKTTELQSYHCDTWLGRSLVTRME